MKYLLTLLFVFTLLSLKVNAQDSPRILKKVTQNYYDEGLPSLTYYSKVENNFKYDIYGNVIEEDGIFFDVLNNDSIINWTGIKYDFNFENQLFKKTEREYNWEIDLWINSSFEDYFYDNQGCLKESIHQSNSINSTRSKIEYIRDNDCKILQEIRNYDIDGINTSPEYGEVNYEYFNDNSYQREYSLTIGTFFIYKVLGTYTKDGDLLHLVRYSTDGINITSEYFYDYDFRYYDNGLIKKKKTTEHRLDYSLDNIPSDTINLLSINTSKYFYNCDGTIAQEQTTSYTVTANNWFFIVPDSTITDYFYEGKNDCFDFENKSFAEIHPNPTVDFIKIKSPLFGSGDTVIRIFDLVGRVLLETKNNFRKESFKLDLPDLPNGGYIVQLTSRDQVVNKKIIIAK